MKILNRLNKIPDNELKRKILHVMFGIIGLVLLIYNIVNPLIIFIILVIGIIISLLSMKFKIPVISYFLKNFERQKDMQQLPGRGVIFAVIGSLIALKLFPQNIALASISILIFGDPISYFIGMAFGKTKIFLNKSKNIEGHISGFLVSSIITMFFVPIALAIAGSLIAMISELLIIKIKDIKIDDNLIIPLAAGTIMFILNKIFF
jgi:dolichol kinase